MNFRALLITAILLLFSCRLTAGEFSYTTHNYDVRDYRADLQNWDIALDHTNGYVLVANNNGLLRFNGNNWALYTVPGDKGLRALCLTDSCLYSAGVGNLGYWQRTRLGTIEYHALDSILPDNLCREDLYWSIAKEESSIYFQSFSRILQYDGKQFRVLSNDCHMLMQQVGEHIYVHRLGEGIYRLHNGKFTRIINQPAIGNREMKFAVPGLDGSVWFGMNDGMVFILSKDGSVSQSDRLMQAIGDFDVDAGAVHNNYLAVGTLGGGIFIFTRNGDPITRITHSQGLQGNIVHRMQFADGKVWISLDNGLSCITSNPDIRLWKTNNEIGHFYDALNHNGFIYIATNQGLYTTANLLDPTAALTTVTTEETISIGSYKGQILCSTRNGCYSLQEDGHLLPLTEIKGFRKPAYVAEHGVEYLISPTYSTIAYLGYDKDWSFSSTIDNLVESFELIVPETPTVLWALNLQKGIARIHTNQEHTKAQFVTRFDNVKQFDDLTRINILPIDGTIYFFCPSGAYTFNVPTGSFVRDDNLSDTLHHIVGNIRSVAHTTDNYFWMTNGFELFQMRFSSSKVYLVNKIPLYDPELRPSDNKFNIVLIGDRKYLLSTEDGIAVLNTVRLRQWPDDHGLLHIENVSYKDQDNRTVFLPLNGKNSFKIPASSSDIRISAAKSAFATSPLLRYKINDTEWSEWSVNGNFTFRKLPSGELAITIEGYNGDSIDITLHVMRPFYASTGAIAIYVLIAAAVLVLTVRTIAVSRQRKIIEDLRKQQRIRDVKNVQLTNEQLKNTVDEQRNEINEKLRSISQKQELLIAIDKEIDSQKRELGDRYPKKMYDRLKKIVMEGISSEKEDFLLFQNYYQEINHDFLLRLKEQHQDLSPQDLKFCCLIRSNLSTKDIAAILNITTKSVDLKRYRIKKKLGIEGNLNDYILSV